LLVVLFSSFAEGTPLKKEINTPSPEKEFLEKRVIIRIFIAVFSINHHP